MGSAALDSRRVAASSPLAFSRFCKMVMARKVDGVEIFEGAPQPFVPWPHQRDILQASMSQRRVIVLKARQLGVTWAWALLALWYVCSHPGTQVVIVSVGERESKGVIRRIKYLYESLPASLRNEWVALRFTDEQVEIKHGEGNSLIMSLPSSSTAGRGETINLLILDEAAHWEDSSNRMAALLPTQADIGQVVVSSTANGIGGYYYDTWEQGAELGWSKIFAGALARPDRSPDWVARERAQLDLKGAEDGKSGLGAQEYPFTEQEAFISSGHCIFPTDVLQDYLDNSVRDAEWRGGFVMDDRGVKAVQDDTGLWRVWGWRRPGRKYLATGDPCGSGAGRDAAHIVVGDAMSLDQVACLHGRPDPEDFARNMYRAGWMWHDDQGSPAVLAPEANNDGRAVLALLREWGYPNLWAAKRFDQRRAEETVQHGWLTTGASRPVMIAALQEGLKYGLLGIRDKLAIGEFQRFISNPRTGRNEAMEGYHDDRTMTWAMFAAVGLRESSGVGAGSQGVADDLPEGSYRKPSSLLTMY